MVTEPTAVEITGESLAGVDVFRGMPAVQRRALAALCQGRRYGPQQQIVSQADRGRDVLFIVSGDVRVTTFSLAGKEVAYRDQHAGQMFGELSAIDGEPRSAYVVALAETVIASMPASAFWTVLRDYPAVAEATLKRLAQLVRSLSDRVFEFSTLAVRNRIHAELLRLARAHMADAGTARIEPPPTHAEIASRVSTHREAVTRELSELAHAGIVARDGAALLVPDVARLARMVDEVLGR